MAKIDNERKTFWGLDVADTVFSKIDAHYLLILTYLMLELRKSNQNPRELNREIERQLDEFTQDLTQDIYQALESQVIDGMAEAVFTLASSWTIADAREYLDNSRPDNLIGGTPQPNYLTGSDEALAILARKRLEGTLTPNDAREAIIEKGIQREATRVLFEDTYKDLLMATNNTDARLKRVVREITSEVMQQQSLLGQGNVNMAKALEARLTEDAIYKRLTKDGLIGIVDRGGKRWSIDTYSKMVVRTKVTQAHLETTKRLGAQMGLDLALVSTHDAIDACNGWEGVVVSVNGMTEGYPNLDDAIATNELFHPNCRHHISLINSMNDLSASELDIHKRKLPQVANPESRRYYRKSHKF